VFLHAIINSVPDKDNPEIGTAIARPKCTYSIETKTRVRDTSLLIKCSSPICSASNHTYRPAGFDRRAFPI